MNLIKKLRFLIRFLSAVIRKQYKLVILGLFLGIISYLFLPKLAKLINILPLPQRTIKIGLVGQYFVDNLPEEVLNEISYGLTKISDNNEVVPLLCEDWNVNDEGKTFVFNIKKDKLFWHDNKVFEIKDINYNFKDIPFSFLDNKISFFLKEPFSPFPIVLSKPLFKRGLIGLGEYKVKKIVKNGKYVGSILLSHFKKSNMPDKLFRFYKSENELKTGFNLGEINKINKFFNLEGISIGNSVKISKSIMKNAYLGVFFNTSLPTFSDKAFRQALAYAIPKESGESRALGPLDPDSWAYNPDVKPYEQDMEKAKKLLGNEKVENKKNIVISTLPQYQEIAEQIKTSWGLIGIDSEIKIIFFVPEEFEVLLIAREISHDPDQYYFWHSTQPGNISNYKSPRIDKLLEDGRKTFDKEERKSIYFDFQRFLVEESPVIFLIHPTVYQVERD